MTVFACSQSRYKCVVCSALGFITLLFLLHIAEWVTQPQILTFSEAKTKNPGTFSVIFDRNKQVLDIQRRQFEVQQLPWQSLAHFSELDVQTILTNEDKRFYSHGGVDFSVMLSVVWDALQGKLVRGGSTISMQLARMLSPKDSLPRSSWGKWLQFRAAWALERHWTKSQILEAYLNLVPLRGDVRGIHTAKKIWFNHEPQLPPKTKSVLLTAMIPSPQAQLSAIANRACRLAVVQKIEQSCDALKKTVETVFASSLGSSVHIASPWPSFAPHAARRITQKGGDFLSTLDAKTQQTAQVALNNLLDDLFEANVRDAAAVVLDNTTGEVLAYVGSAGRRSTAPEVDGAKSKRQPGSTLKSFLYALGFESGKLREDDRLSARLRSFNTGVPGEAPYKPHQNTNYQPKNDLSVREALAGSINLPAVVLLEKIGVEAFAAQLTSLQLLPSVNTATSAGDKYGLSLALGSEEVDLLSLTNAYRSLANGGMYSPWRFVVGSNQADTDLKRVVDADAVSKVADILSDPKPRLEAFGRNSPLNTSYYSVVKTGTSNGERDNWTLGYSKRYTVGVWVGNFEGDAMDGISGVAGAAKAWRVILDYLEGIKPPVITRY